jgi:hypothetical protein
MGRSHTCCERKGVTSERLVRDHRESSVGTQNGPRLPDRCHVLLDTSALHAFPAAVAGPCADAK